MDNSQLPDIRTVHTEEIQRTVLVTHNGQRLSPKEDKFIQLYIKLADPQEAAKQAGYALRDTIKNKDAGYLRKGRQLLTKDYIQDEIAYRMQEFRKAQVADTDEVLRYLTAVMRGEEKDQFGIEVSIADRTAAAKELNRRFGEINKAANVEGKKEVRFVIERKDNG